MTPRHPEITLRLPSPCGRVHALAAGRVALRRHLKEAGASPQEVRDALDAFTLAASDGDPLSVCREWFTVVPDDGGPGPIIARKE